MKVLVVGGGGREHAVIRKLKESALVDKIYAAPGNGGIARDAECADIKATDVEGMTKFAVENSIDFVVVTPDDPLVLGMVDALNKEGIKTFGPDKAAAIIEGSKVFSKALMKKYNIPTAEYETFDSAEKALEYIGTQTRFPIVIKADGLALGKGVIIAENKEDALKAVRHIMENKAFGEAGSSIVIEEFLQGLEISVLAFTDGVTICPMISSMDHKRALDGDKGLNTGGMGTIAPHPIYTQKLADECMNKIFRPTVDAMAKEGRQFKGCLYFGLILTEHGPKVIEYNCRFGDPETQVVLPLLKTDLMEIFLAIYEGKLDSLDIRWHEKSAACVILASGGYPGKYNKGCEIKGLNGNGQIPGATVFHSGTQYKDGGFYTNGGRVLGVTVIDETLEKALKSCYGQIGNISFEGMHFRKDIGVKVIMG